MIDGCWRRIDLRWAVALVALVTVRCEPIQVGSSRRRDADASPSVPHAGATSFASGGNASEGTREIGRGGAGGSASDAAGLMRGGANDNGATGDGAGSATRLPRGDAGGATTTIAGGAGASAAGVGGVENAAAGRAGDRQTARVEGGRGGIGSMAPSAGSGSTTTGAGGLTDGNISGNGSLARGGSSGGAGQGGGTFAPACPGSPISIRGRALSPRGQPLEGVQMTLSGESTATTWTNVRGEYAFRELCPGVNVLVPSRADLRFCTPQATFANLAKDVEEDFTGSPGGCVEAELTPRLAILIFDPMVPYAGATERLSKVRGWQDPIELANQYRRSIETVTNGRVRYEITRIQTIDEFPRKADEFQYDAESYAQCVDGTETACHQPDAVDYSLLAASLKICDGVNDGSIDEVRLFGGPYFGFAMVQRLGPVPPALGPVPDTDCTRVVNVFGFNYDPGLDSLLQGMQNVAEAFLDGVYAAPEANLTVNAYQSFESPRALAPGLSSAGCGGHGYAPNAVDAFQFDSVASVDSHCDDFYEYPNLPAQHRTQPVDCTQWGCSASGFHRYWFRHLPAAKGIASDGMLADWWRYLIRPDDYVASVTHDNVTCSSSYLSGWCPRVTDGHHGTCNDGEWATSNRATGWVEFHWPATKSISAVTLFDRGCAEQVLRGHIEFSDGSPRLTFDELDDSGSVGRRLAFAPKSLSWLRVYIDESAGGPNPGFGEITFE